MPQNPNVPHHVPRVPRVAGGGLGGWGVVVWVAREERAPKIKGLVLEVSLYETQQRSVWVNWACQKSLLFGHYLSSHLSSLPLLLQRLYLRGRLETLPHCIPSLHSLVMLYLKCLPNLVHLELSQVVKGDTVYFGAGGFKKLKRLGIDEFDELRCIQDN
ncbi:hypothetical protein ACE6H2_016468 [Prunus campanulata]